MNQHDFDIFIGALARGAWDHHLSILEKALNDRKAFLRSQKDPGAFSEKLEAAQTLFNEKAAAFEQALLRAEAESAVEVELMREGFDIIRAEVQSFEATQGQSLVWVMVLEDMADLLQQARVKLLRGLYEPAVDLVETARAMVED